MEEKITVSSASLQKDTLIQPLVDRIDQLERVLALMLGHVYWMNREGVYLGCNRNQANFAKLYGKDQVIGKHFSQLVPWEDAKAIGETNFRVMELGEAYIGEEVCSIPGHEGIYLSQKVPLRNKQGEILGLLGVSFNITDRKRMEKELREAKEIAEIANQTKTEFIRNMEHDIRLPLCGITSVGAHLNAMEKDDRKKDFLNGLEIAANELLDYLDNIVEFSQMNSGTVPLILKPLNLEQMLTGILKLESAAIQHKGLDVSVIYPASLPKSMTSDRFRLRRILLNLINNAVKFTPEGSIKITVEIAEQMDEDLCLEISIEDTGIGIEKKYHEIIFEKFTRCNPSNKGVHKGTGLGLWVAKQFISDLKGEILLDSKVGKGSVFTCRLPFKISSPTSCA